MFVGSRFTADMAAAAEKLRLIHVAGAGTDKIDFAALPPDVLVANTFHHERSIAEYVVAAAVMLRRGFLTQDRKLRDNVWATSVYDSAIPQSPTLGARTSASSASATSACELEPVAGLRMHRRGGHRFGPGPATAGCGGPATPATWTG